MAARWGAGEETLTACNMDFFPMDTLEETAGRSSGETMEALQSCLDPSILSIFEDTPTIQPKGIDEESEATLLTALTEILDNVDEENLSPFDTLPEADLLSGQKGREQSPLRRLLCLSRSPTEKDVRSSLRTLSTGKNLTRKLANSLQRSDGEEEDDGSLSLSPAGRDSCPDNEPLNWEGLTLPLPVTFEQEGEDGVSVSLGDLVRHMHSYCMAISVENEEGEQMLPEGGIVLEVVDQGENGEPILAIPNLDLSFSLPPEKMSSENEKKVSVDNEDAANDTSEDIVVDDDDDDLAVNKAPERIVPLTTGPDVKDDIINKRQKEDFREKSPSRRKKKKKCKQKCQSNPVEGRVLRSSRREKELPKKSEIMSVKKEKKHKPPNTPVASTSSSPKQEEIFVSQTKTQSETTTTKVLPKMNPKAVATQSLRQDKTPSTDEKTSTTAVSPQQPNGILEQTAPVNPITAPPVVQFTASPVSPATTLNSEITQETESISEALPPVVPAVPEPKPKSLSLEQYRRLRQQKKPAPVEKNDAITKWPSLPELPRELPPIPCLPNPSPKDPRRFNSQMGQKDAAEVKPAWQPRGPAAPPTPEALLVPPAYMVASSRRVSATAPTPKPQQVPDPPKLPQQVPDPPKLPQQVPGPPKLPQQVPDPPKLPHQPPAAQPVVLCAPQTSGRSTMCATPEQSAGKGGIDEIRQSQPGSLASAECTNTTTKTTTDGIKPVTATGSHVSVPQKTTDVAQRVPKVAVPTSLNKPVTSDSKLSKPNANAAKLCSSETLSDSQKATTKPVVLKSKEKPTILQKTKSPTQELIEAFTTEIGIEAADLTSLLEQFEETQAKEEQCVPEVSGRAAAVGNSSVDLVPEKSLVERVRANDLSSIAGLTPPATPPHQMWKPLAPVALLGKNKLAEISKSNSSKVIQIEARPLPLVKSRSKPTLNSAPVDPILACMDHDYCLPNKEMGPGEAGKRWNVKQQSYITIKPIKPQATTTTQKLPDVPATTLQSASKTRDVPQTQPLEHRSSDEMETSVLETPDASPARQETESSCKARSPKRVPFGRSYRRHSSSRSPSPAQSPKERIGGRSRKRKSHRSPSPMSSCSDSDSESHSSRSRSRSFSPTNKRYRHHHRSDSSSSSSSCSSSRSRYSVSRSPPRRRRYSYSSSRSGSWSRSRSRSLSPQRRAQWNRSKRLYSPTYRSYFNNGTHTNVEEVKIRKEKAIEERRVVYVGRIRGTMTQKELRERFSYFGEIEECTLHFRDHGDNYGFVTYYDKKDAFTAIENGSRLRKPDELPFDLCFGGRRQFCQTSYADLDSNREYDPLPSKGKFHALDFDTLLKQAQQNLKR